MPIPCVTREAFGNLAGSALASDIARLSVNSEYEGLALFSDLGGAQMAILPIGPAEDYKGFGELEGLILEGLRPLCILRLERGGKVSAMSGAQRAGEDELARLTESLREREVFLAECERKMAEVGQSLAEREALIEQREHALEEKERDFFRRSGESVTRLGAAARQG